MLPYYYYYYYCILVLYKVFEKSLAKSPHCDSSSLIIEDIDDYEVIFTAETGPITSCNPLTRSLTPTPRVYCNENPETNGDIDNLLSFLTGGMNNYTIIL